MTLISIIGAFDTTLLNLVNEFAPELERVILMFDDSTASAKNLAHHQSALDRFKKCHGHNYIVETASVIDEDNVTKLDALIDLTSRYDKVMINISDALGSTAAYLGARIINERVSLVAFNPLENEYNIISERGFENKRLNRTLSIKDYVESLGYELNEMRGQPIRPKEIIFEVFKNFEQFQKTRSDLIRSSSIKFSSKSNMHQQLYALKIIDQTGKLIDRNYLQGGLFEEYIYWIASEVGFDDLLCSAEIRFSGDPKEGTLIHNEFDLLAFKNNRLYLFECKFTKSFELDDLIYKYMALKEHIKNDSKGIIVTVNPKISPNIQESQINAIPPKLRQKASLFDIHVLSNILQYDRLKKELNSIIHPQGVKVIEPLNVSVKPKTYVYFLGGYDLEMFEIRKILENNNAKLIDSNLSWGAKTSDYKVQIDALNENEIPVFIELEIDYIPSCEYELIDHHGDYAHRKTSIEQIAQRFDIKLDRFQTLVGINDKSHIRGLKKYGVSDKEIEVIRYLDRQKQGVTEADEEFGKSALLNTKKVNGIAIIETKANHFSPITDCVNYMDYIIYNEKKLCLYTQKIKSAKLLFHTFIQKNQAYYGGDKQMYFCLKDNILSSKEISDLVMKITKKL